MSARNELLAAYSQWRQWTEAEGEAIAAANWQRAGECQNAKKLLGSLIIGCTQTAQAESEREGSDWAEVQRELRPVVELLITLETRNGEVLATQRRAAEEQRAQLESTRRNLRRVRSYAPAREMAWESYS